MKVIAALQKSKLETAPIYRLIKEADVCFERAEREKKIHQHKPTTLYHLSKYLIGRKNWLMDDMIRYNTMQGWQWVKCLHKIVFWVKIRSGMQSLCLQKLLLFLSKESVFPGKRRNNVKYDRMNWLFLNNSFRKITTVYTTCNLAQILRKLLDNHISNKDQCPSRNHYNGSTSQ